MARKGAVCHKRMLPPEMSGCICFQVSSTSLLLGVFHGRAIHYMYISEHIAASLHCKRTLSIDRSVSAGGLRSNIAMVIVQALEYQRASVMFGMQCLVPRPDLQ